MIFVTEPVAPVQSSDESKESNGVYRPPKANQVPRFIYRSIQQAPSVVPGDSEKIIPPPQHNPVTNEQVEIESSSALVLPAMQQPTFTTYAPSVSHFQQPPIIPVYYGYYY